MRYFLKRFRLGRILLKIWRRKGLYAQWLGSLLISGIGIASSFYGLTPLFANGAEGASTPLSLTSHNFVIAALIVSLTIFGILNLLALTVSNKNWIRYKRAQQIYHHIHKAAEEARNFRHDVTIEANCTRAIRMISFTHLAEALKALLGFTPCITLKYHCGAQLFSIRCGNKGQRKESIEPSAENRIFQKIFDPNYKNRHIYVCDVMTDDELQGIFGDDFGEVRDKIGAKYRTFLSIPLRTSMYDTGDFARRTTIGLLGIDAKVPHSLEDLEEEDYEALYAIVDILSECVVHLIQFRKKAMEART